MTCVCGSKLVSGEVKFTFESVEDGHGRRQFFMDWFDDGLVGVEFPKSDGRRCPHRGQIFRAVPGWHLDKARAEGKTVIVEDRYAHSS